jgi:hypothetical protein
MARGLPSDVIDVIGNDHVRVFLAVDVLLDSPNDLHFWTGSYPLEYDGYTYTGASWMLQISDIQEGSDISAKGATMSLTGLPSSLVDLALDEPYQGRLARIHIGFLNDPVEAGSTLKINATDYLLIDATSKLGIASNFPTTMYTLFSGYIDQMTIDQGPESCTISLAVENKLIDLERPRIRRYTDENHQLRYPGDLAFEFVTRLQNETLPWNVDV